MNPDDFWSGTLDEAILTYRGSVDRLRFFRNGFNLIHCSLVGKERVNIKEVLPLPFDYEITDQVSSTEDLISEYNRLKEAGAI